MKNILFLILAVFAIQACKSVKNTDDFAPVFTPTNQIYKINNNSWYMGVYCEDNYKISKMYAHYTRYSSLPTPPWIKIKSTDTLIIDRKSISYHNVKNDTSVGKGNYKIKFTAFDENNNSSEQIEYATLLYGYNGSDFKIYNYNDINFNGSSSLNYQLRFTFNCQNSDEDGNSFNLYAANFKITQGSNVLYTDSLRRYNFSNYTHFDNIVLNKANMINAPAQLQVDYVDYYGNEGSRIYDIPVKF